MISIKNIALQIIVAFLTISSIAYAEDKAQPKTLEELKVAIEKVRAESGVAGVSIAIVDKNGPVWMEGFGEADKSNHKPVTQDTIFRIGSVSKMFVALSVLQLVEQGKLHLDDKLSDLAPEIYFENEWEQTHPIRLVHLLEHTTGWNDISFSVYSHQDANISLEDALAFHPHYRKSRWVPGTRFAYNNAGPAIAAYIVQKITGQLYEDYVQEHWFNPLQMKSATFFESELYKNSGAKNYSSAGASFDYWNLILRPAGSINASTADMAKYVQFLIARGEYNQQRLLSEQSFTRMETPTSTLGAKAGTQAGYGLYNYLTGFKRARVAFRGHDGDLPGSHTRLSYVPELNIGYVLIMNQDHNPALNKIQELIRGYLLKDVNKPEQQSIEFPEKYKQLSGYYIPIALRSDSFKLISELAGVMHFTVSDNRLHRMPLFGGWPAPSDDYAINEHTLVSSYTGLPTIAIVNDPLAGEVVEVSSDAMGPTLKKVSAFRVFGTLGLIACTLVLSVISILFAPIWLVRLMRRKISGATVSIRLWPLITSITPVLGMVVFLAFANMETMGEISLVTLSIFVCTSLYLVFAVYSLINIYRLANAQVNSIMFWHSAILSICHVSLAIMLACYGMLMIRLWV